MLDVVVLVLSAMGPTCSCSNKHASDALFIYCAERDELIMCMHNCAFTKQIAEECMRVHLH